jgi:bifunctional DNA-binding transcriptional regulator/antitoxin component of YhaV-PrlF toxin-antitoxin module
MTSRVTIKGQTVVPISLRRQFGIAPGSTLEWQSNGDSIRVVKLEAPGTGGGFLNALRRLGRVPPATRDIRPVKAT